MKRMEDANTAEKDNEKEKAYFNQQESTRTPTLPKLSTLKTNRDKLPQILNKANQFYDKQEIEQFK